MMKVLVTGATGGIGGLIIRRLLDAGHRVVATSRDEAKARALDFFDRVEYVPYDFHSREDAELFAKFGRPDSLIHPAWDKLSDFRNPEHTDVILEDHKAFVTSLVRDGLRDVNGVGTCYECGLHEGLLDETCQDPPTLPYAAAKDGLRRHLEAVCARYHATFKWIRMFYVFGPVKGRKNLYTLLMEAVQRGDATFNMSGGEQVRDFLPPDEIARNIVAISMQKEVTGIVNCCSGKPVKLKDFVNDFLRKNNYQISLNLGHYPYPDYEPMVTWGSVEKLNKILNR